MAVGGVQLGVQILGDEVGLKASLANAVASADAWATATEAAGVKAARGIELVGVAAKQAEIAYGKLGLSVAKYAEGTVGAEAAAVRYEATVQGLYEKQIAAANAAAAAQERAAVRYQSSLLTTGRALTTYVTLPLAAVGYESIKLATQFQASMTRVQTYAGASAAEVKAMSQSILDSAGQLPQGPIKAAEALYHLESIGIRGKSAFDALKASALAAGAGQSNLTDATTALGGALVANIKGAQDAKQAMAGLIAIAGQGNMTMQQLTDALGTGLLVKAGNVGISLKEVGAALDVLVDRGIPARRAATYLGTTFALMVAPSKAAKTAAEDLGINWEKMGTDLQKPGGLLTVLQMFHDRVQAVGQTRGMRDVMDMFGRSRQSTGIQTLIESFNAPVSSYAQKLQQYDAGVKQATERMNEYQQTAQYKMHTALSTIEADLIKVGTGAAPGVADAMKGIANSVDVVVNAFKELPGPIKEVLGGVAGFAAIIGPMILLAGGAMKVSRAIANISTELGLVGPAAATGAGTADAEITTIGVAAERTTSEVLAMNEALAAGGVLLPEVLTADVGGGLVSSLSAGAGRVMSGLMRGGMFAIGGVIAGQMAQSMIGGTAGQEVGGTIEGAGVGAGIGTMIAPGIGTAIGAGVGALTGAIVELEGHSKSFVQQMGDMQTSIESFGAAAQQAGMNITALRSDIANQRVNRDQAQKALQEARAAEVAARGTNGHAEAADRLTAAEYNLHVINDQIIQDNQKIAALDKQRTDALDAQKKKVEEMSQSLKDYDNHLSILEKKDQAGTRGFTGTETQTLTADQELQRYIGHLQQLASSAASSNPKLASVARQLIQVAEAVGKIPPQKVVQILIEETFKQSQVPFKGSGMDPVPFFHPDLQTAGSTKKAAPVPALSAAQATAVALAANPNDVSAVNEQIRLDNEAIARLKAERAAGKIGNQQYVDQVTAYYNDRQSMYTTLASLDKKHTSAAGKAASEFKKRVTTDELLAKARLDIQSGDTSAAQDLLRKDKARLEHLMAEAKTADERLAIERQLLAVERTMKEKAASFKLPLALSEQQARADALAAMDPTLQGPTSLQLKLAEEAKAAAMKAINSHKLTMQGLIDAWGVVQQANQTIAQGTGGLQANLYHAVSTDAVADAVKGLNDVQKIQLREALAQRDAHRGFAPTNPAANGFAAPTAAAGPGPRPFSVNFNGATFTFQGVQDVRKLMAELEKLVRQKHTRSGGRR